MRVARIKHYGSGEGWQAGIEGGECSVGARGRALWRARR